MLNPELLPFNNKVLDYIIKSFNSWFIVAEGSPRAGKNVMNAQIFAMRVEASSERLHVAGAVTQSLAQINILDCNGLCVERYFRDKGYNLRYGKFKDRNALYIDKKNHDDKIILFGSGLNKTSGKLVKGLTIGCAYVTEANECHIDFIEEIERRTRSAKDRVIIHDLNPKGEGHKYYKYLKEFEERQKNNPDYGYFHRQFSTFDNGAMQCAITGKNSEALNSVLKSFEVGSKKYRREILGERVQLDGLIYDFRDEMLSRYNREDCQEFYIAIDYGNNNALVFLLIGQVRNSWHVVDEFYHISAKDGSMTDLQKYQAMKKFIGDCRIKEIIIDPSALSYITEIRQHREYKVRGAINKVIYGIEKTRRALDNKQIMVSPKAKNLINEFGLYKWEESNDGIEKPVKEHDHALDSLRYFVATVLTEKVTLRGKGIGGVNFA